MERDSVEAYPTVGVSMDVDSMEVDYMKAHTTFMEVNPTYISEVSFIFTNMEVGGRFHGR